MFKRYLILMFILCICLLCSCSLLPQIPKITIEYLPNTVTVGIDQDVTVEATIMPEKDINSVKSISYKSQDEKIATVDFTTNTIIVHGKSQGTTKIYSVCDNQNEFSFLVKVAEAGSLPGTAEQKYLTTNKTTLAVDSGKDMNITAELVNGTPVEQNGLVWTSSDPALLTITGCGNSVIASTRAPGNVLITVTHPAAVNVLTISVKINDIFSNITLNVSGITLEIGNDYVLKASSKGAALDINNLTWHTDPEDQNILTILGRGESVTLLANNPGNVTVTACTISGASASCDVIVREQKSIILNPPAVSLKTGESVTIQINKTPADLKLNVSSTNVSVVNFVYDETANTISVNALQEGKTSIQVQAVGSNLLAKTELTITQDKLFEVDPQAINCQPGTLPSFHYTVLPADEVITWTISDPNIATISVDKTTYTVNINSQKEGTAIVTGRTSTGITRTVNLNCWYSSISINYAGSIIGGNSSSYAREKTYLDLTNNIIGCGDHVRLQVDLSFPQKGIKINSITWAKSTDFDKELQFEELDGGRRVIFDYKPGWTAHEQFKDGGTITYTVNYGNNQTYSRTFTLRLWIQLF